MRIKYTFGILFVQSFLPRCRGKFYTKISFFYKKSFQKLPFVHKSSHKSCRPKKKVFFEVWIFEKMFFSLS